MLFISINSFAQNWKAQYDLVEEIEDNAGQKLFRVMKHNGAMGVCDNNGNLIIPCNYNIVNKSLKNVQGKIYIGVVDKGGNEGLCDGNGREVLPCKYGSYSIIEEKGKVYIRVEDKGGNKGLCDGNGREILPCKYGDISTPKEANGKIYISVKDKGGNKGLCDGNGREILPCRYSDFTFIDDYILLQDSKGKYGLADYNRGVILECISEEYLVFLKDNNIMIYIVKDENGNGKYGFIGRTPLRILTPAKYDFCFYMENYMCVNIEGVVKDRNCLGGKWGVVDANGDEIIKPQYTFIHLAADSLFTVNTGGQRTESHQTIGGKWGLVDSKGNTLIPCQYDEPIIFKQDVAMVKKDGEVKLIKNPLVDNSAVTIAQSTVASYKKKASGPAVSRYPAPDSDVDKDIPQASAKSENTFAFVVANENYPDAPVPYALNDGRMFAQYCEKTLGIPQKNINLYEDATYGNIVTMMDKIKNVATAFEGEASILLYYAGHGFPDEKQGSAYLLPIDGSGSEISTTGYSLKHLYDELSRLPLKRAVVLLDACFSGAKREDDMLAQSRGVAIKVKEEQPKGHLLVFSASQGDETAHQMAEKHHGLFTYYLLKGMQQLQGNANWGDLTDFVTKNVKRQSVVINNKKQTPTVIPSSEIFNTWRTIRLQ